MTAAAHNLPDLAAARSKALMVAGAGLALTLIGAFINPDQFFRSYLVAFLFWAAIPLGSLALLMLHHLVGGGWGIVIRRVLESSTRTFPLTIVLLLPILVNLPRLYEWARPEEVAHDHGLQHKAAYLNVPFFLGRMAFYFAVWLAMSYFLNRFSAEQERDRNSGAKGRLQRMSGIGILMFGFTVTFASIDWVMSLEPHWVSTIYGMLFMIGSALTTLAFTIVTLVRLSRHAPMHGLVQPNHFHDLGTLMFAFIMLWAYVGVSQFLIIWSGNLPEEIPWYLKRLHGGWGVVALILVIFHFAIPFLVLIMRYNKRKAEILVFIASGMLVMRLVDVIWLVQPAFHEGHASVHWMDVTAPVGIGGLWVAFFVWQLSQRPLDPVDADQLGGHGAGHGGH